MATATRHARSPHAEARRAVVSSTVQDLNPGVFAFVMASGIVSTALLESGAPAASAVLLVIGLLGYVALVAGYGWRLLWWRRRFVEDLSSPRGFAFLTFVAASNVLAARLALGGMLRPAVLLFAVGVVGWLVLGYVVPLGLIVSARRQQSIDQVNGTWFIWVVGTQSVAVAAAPLARLNPAGAAGLLAVLASLCWSIGVVLYVVMASLGLTRLLVRPVDSADLLPPYWVFMGAAAITVLAGARLIQLPETGQPLPHRVVLGAVAVLWAFCTWLIPLLLALGVWRHLLRGVPLRYESGLWSLAFPVGMYGVATRELGRAAGTPWLTALGSGEAWMAAAVWVAVFSAMVASLIRALRSGHAVR